MRAWIQQPVMDPYAWLDEVPDVQGEHAAVRS